MLEKMDYTLEIVDKLNSEEIKGVLKVNRANLYKNGGQLHYEGILGHDYAVLAKCGERVIGYTLLKEGFFTKKDIYVMQVAVDTSLKHSGIGSQMYNYAYKHFKGYKLFSANVNPSNKVSKAFHQKNGFDLIGQNGLGLIYTKKVRMDARKKITKAQKESFSCTVEKSFEHDDGPSL